MIVKGCIADFTVGYARIADHPSDHPLYIGVENGGVVAIEPGVGAGAPTYDAGGRPACEGLSRPHPHSTNATSSHNLPDYGIAIGNLADVVVIDALSPEQAVAEICQPLTSSSAAAGR